MLNASGGGIELQIFVRDVQAGKNVVLSMLTARVGAAVRSQGA